MKLLSSSTMSKTTLSSQKNKCRVWWPENVLHPDPSSSLLFGWVFTGGRGDSVDVVVASVVSDEVLRSSGQFDNFENALNSINRTMPNRLKEKALFTFIGHCKSSEHKHLNGQIKHGISETRRGIFVKSGIWVELVLCEMKKTAFGNNKERKFVPVLESLRFGPDLFENCDCHVILYDCPVQGNNHYSLCNWGIHKKTGTNLKKPKWIRELENKPTCAVSEYVILALNCSNFAKSCIEKRAGINRPANCSFFLAISDALWICVAFCVASISTIVYIFLQLFHKLLSYKSVKSLLFIIRKIFPYSCKNIHIRSCQFLYWPVFLHGTVYSSSNPNTEFTHKSSLNHLHLLSTLLTTTFLSLLLSLLSKPLFSLSLSTTSHHSSSLLRSSLLWLMHSPAGFKLNTQLSKAFGTISLNLIQSYAAALNAVQLYSTALNAVQFYSAIVGVVFFGVNGILGVVRDLVRIGGVHVALLHWMVGLVYGNQIRALASLWRIFRGIKYNPLRNRIDTHTSSVEQHIVGSLIFTPLLLLLPTTSVFYLFFTILNTQIALLCYFLEMMISVLYGVPVCEVVIWGLNKRRFPSGIWFENLNEKEGALVSLVRSNYATIGEVIGPHFKKIFCTVPSSFCKSLAYSVLSGQRIPSNLNTNLPPLMPWMNISFRNYWKLCYQSVLASRSVQKRRK